RQPLRSAAGRLLRPATAAAALPAQPWLLPDRAGQRGSAAALSLGPQRQGHQSQTLFLSIAGYPQPPATATAANAVTLTESPSAMPAYLSRPAAACAGHRNPDATGRILHEQPATGWAFL